MWLSKASPHCYLPCWEGSSEPPVATLNPLPMTDPRNQQLVTWEQSFPRVPVALLRCGSSAEQGLHAAKALHSSAFGAWPHVLSLEGHVGLERGLPGASVAE